MQNNKRNNQMKNLKSRGERWVGVNFLLAEVGEIFGQV